jgi:type IV pilus assembly protein PilX
MVLVSSLLLLLVVTILALGMFHSFGLDEKIAGNTREKQRALQAAVSAESYAEWYLSNGQTLSNVTCGGVVAYTAAQICLNTLPAVVTGGSGGATGNVAILPWTNSLGAPVGVTYLPPNMTLNSTSPTAGTYWQTPMFYISYLGIGTGANGGTGSVYQIDSVGYGGSPNTAAVVESTYIVQTSTQNLDGG